PVVLAIAAFASLAGAVAGRDRRWHLTVLALAIGSVGLIVALGAVLRIEQRVGASIPRSFFLWAALPVFAIAVTVAGWPRARWRRRGLCLASIVLITLFGANEINVHYAYLPTLGDAVGMPMRGQVSAASLVAVQRFNAEDHPSALVPLLIPGTISHFHPRTGYVWLPPAYFDLDHPELPVVMILAGVPGNPSDMIRAGRADEVASAYAHAHDGVAPILVFPDDNGGFTHDTECVDGPRGNAETYLTVDVPRAIERRFGTPSDARHWAVIGYSEGGTCALTLALAHPDKFSSFVDIAGDLRPTAARTPHRTIMRLFGGRRSQWYRHDPLTLLRLPALRHATGWIVAGSGDLRANLAAHTLVDVARQSGVDVQIVSVPGAHSFSVVVRALQLELPRVADMLLAASPGRAT
ncbi:MAG: hypothetical protein QOI47_1880, partial [Actinomycetota bacterium]|nr:hypothetical protein [Actinomycetota bacterium]